jgi:hypothetical protein
MFFAGYVATVSYWTALTDRSTRAASTLRQPARGGGERGLRPSAPGFASAVFFQVLLGVGSPRPTCRGCGCSPTAFAVPTEPLHRVLHVVLRHRHRALARRRRIHRSGAGWRRPSSWRPRARVRGALVFLLRTLPARARARFIHILFPSRAWREVLRDRACAGYTLGYMAHCLELFGSRGWMVAFLAFSRPACTRGSVSLAVRGDRRGDQPARGSGSIFGNEWRCASAGGAGSCW